MDSNLDLLGTKLHSEIGRILPLEAMLESPSQPGTKDWRSGKGEEYQIWV